MKLGEDEELEAELKRRIDGQKPGNCCTLIYTSGTTGDPKGVMLSHDNGEDFFFFFFSFRFSNPIVSLVTWTAGRVTDCIEVGEEHVVSYLPLSHVAAQMFDIYLPLVILSFFFFFFPVSFLNFRTNWPIFSMLEPLSGLPNLMR